jgi:holdfast attachment protein HfaA
MSKTLKIALLAGFAAIAASSAAQAVDYSNAATYSSAYGMSAGQENTPINPSMRDANGNLTMVNGQLTSGTMSQQSGVQTANTMSGNGSGSGTAYGTASAVGNSLNVVTTGSWNTVIVNSVQTNNGNQTATVTQNGH